MKDKCKGRIPLFTDYNSFHRCFVSESTRGITWHKRAYLSHHHLCYGFICLKYEFICPPKRFSHSPKRFILFMKWRHLFAIFACRCLHFAQTDLKSLQNEHPFFFFGRDLSPLCPTSLRKTGRFHSPNRRIHSTSRMKNNLLGETTIVGSTWFIANVIGRREITW